MDIELRNNEAIRGFHTADEAVRAWLDEYGTTIHVGGRAVTDVDDKIAVIIWRNAYRTYAPSSMWSCYTDILNFDWPYIHVTNKYTYMAVKDRDYRVIDEQEAVMLRLSDETVLVMAEVPGWGKVRKIIERIFRDITLYR